MSTKKEKYDFPSMYDFFYSNYAILQLLKPKLVDAYLTKNKFDPIYILRGYSYLFEFLIIDLIHNIESIIQEEDISEAIQWGHIDITNKTLIKLKEDNFLLNQIYILNKLRGELSKVRFKQSKLITVDKDKIYSLIDSVIKASQTIDKEIHKEYTIKIVNKSKKIHDLKLLSYVISKLNYIEGNIDFFDSKRKVINAFPMNPTSYLLPNGFKKSYYLQNKLIKIFNKEYFNGYKQIIIYLYSSLIKSNKKPLIELMNKATDWHPFHMLGSIVRKKYVIEYNYIDKIFDMKSKKVKSKLPKLITSPNQLDLIFRRINNLDIKIFKDRHEGDYPNTHAMFQYFLTGAFNIQKKNLEIVEFEQVDGDNKTYSYAIYVPVNGGFWSSSHWFFFEDLTIVNSWEPFSQIKMLVEETNKQLKLDFKKYEIKGDLLKQYVYQKDFYKQFSKKQEVKLNKSKGLLGETIAYYYLAKKYNAVLIDMHKDIKNTDIDVLAKNKDEYYLVQSKMTLPFKDKDVFDLILHFEKVEQILDLKKTKRILFVMDDYVYDNNSTNHMDNKKLNSLSRTNINKRSIKIKKVLKDKCIDIVTYNEIKNELKTRDSKHLFAELDVVFDNY